MVIMVVIGPISQVGAASPAGSEVRTGSGGQGRETDDGATASIPARKATPVTLDSPPDRERQNAPSTAWETRLDRRIRSASGAVRSRWPDWLPLMVPATGLAVVLVLVWLAGEVYDGVTEQEGVAGLDRPALNLALRLRTPTAAHAVTLFTNLGGVIGMSTIAVIGAVALCWWYRSWHPAAVLALAATGSLLMTSVGKAVIGRVRPPLVDAVPPLETSPSFPSGHTLNATVVIGVIAYLVARRLGRQLARTAVVATWVVFVIAIGLSRVYLGHHWLTDVLVGWMLGLAWLVVVVTSYRIWMIRLARPASGRQPAR
jgi:undecaprenyl-diphosphatase